MKAVAQVFAFDLVAKFLLAGAGILVIRLLPPSEYARYTVAVAVVAVLTQVLASTVNRVYIVGHDRLGVDDPVAAALGIQLMAVGAGLVLGLPLLAGNPLLGVLVAALVTATCLAEFAKTMYQRDMRFMRFSLVELSRALVFLSALLVLTRMTMGGLRAWHVLAVQSAALMLVFLVSVGRRVRWSALLHAGDARTLMRAIFAGSYRYLFGYFTVLALLSQLNVLLLRTWADEQVLASYGAAFRYYALLMLALGAVNQVLLPMVQVADAGAMEALLRKNLRLSLAFGAAVALGVALAPYILPLLDGGKYPESIPVFQILAISTIPSMAFSPYVNLMMRREEFGLLLGLVSVAVLANLALGFWLIGPLGAVGAAIAYFVAYVVLNGAIFLRARSHTPMAAPAA